MTASGETFSTGKRCFTMNFDIVSELQGRIPNEAQVMACKQKLMSTVTDAAVSDNGGGGGGGGGEGRDFPEVLFLIWYYSQ